MANFKSIVGVFSVPSDAQSEWSTANPTLPNGVMVRETDTGKFKIGDGVTAYNDLGFMIENELTDSEKALLENAGAANGVAVLNGDGQVPLSALPPAIHGSVSYVSTYADLATVDEVAKGGLVVVLDASGDPTVDAGAAVYAWDSSANPADWIKISEYEGLDVDWSVFFNKNTETLDDINDGSTYVRMTIPERDKLANIEAGADVTDAENVAAAGAVMFADQLFVTAPTPAQIAGATFE